MGLVIGIGPQSRIFREKSVSHNSENVQDNQGESRNPHHLVRGLGLGLGLRLLLINIVDKKLR